MSALLRAAAWTFFVAGSGIGAIVAGVNASTMAALVGFPAEGALVGFMAFLVWSSAHGLLAFSAIRLDDFVRAHEWRLAGDVAK